MTTINLLPWREALREKRKRQFLLACMVTLFIGLGVNFSIYLIVDGKLQAQRFRNQLLSNEVAFYDRRIREIHQLKKVRSALVARMMIIQELQVNRPISVRLMDEMIRSLPKGVYLTRIERKHDRIIMTGRSDSNTGVSQLMRNIETSSWMHGPKLEEIKEIKTFVVDDINQQKKEAHFNEFRLTFILQAGQLIES